MSNYKPTDDSDIQAMVDATREAYRNDWERWELPEIVKATARSLGVRVSDDEVAEIVAEVVPCLP